MSPPRASSLAAALALALGTVAGCASDRDRGDETRASRGEPAPAASATPPRLLVDSVPSDAVVRVDGSVAGTTPLDLEVAPGRHAIAVTGPAGIRDEQVRCEPSTKAVVVVTSWRAVRAVRARTPEECIQTLVSAIATGDRATLDQLALTREEVAVALGPGDVDRVRTGLVRRIDRDAARLAEYAGWRRARRITASGLSVERTKLARDPLVSAVDVVPAPVIRYDVDGRRLTQRLGPLVRVGDGTWKVLSILPTQTWQ